MGTAKQLLPWGKKILIEAVVERALRSKADEVLIVLGADSGRIRSVLKAYPVRTVLNPDPARGMLSSVQRGFRRLAGNVRAVMIMLGDQPAVPVTTINRIIDAYDRTGMGIVLPVYRGRRGHPVLIDRRYRSEILTLDPEIGLRQLMRRHPDDMLEVQVRSRAVLRDIDTLEEYRKAVRAKKDG
jgi:molybdenum cofactor cytidylyltransferase